MTLTSEDIEHIIEFYHKADYRAITDYSKVVELGVEVTDNGNTYTAYPAPGQTIYLDSTGYAVTYGRQKVDVQKNAYFYKWNDDPNVPEDVAFEYVCPYEYMKNPVQS